MTRSTRPTLADIAHRVDEYESTHQVSFTTVRVLPQEDPEYADSGIVVVHLTHGPSSVYLTMSSDCRWTAALTERSSELFLSGEYLVALGEELTMTGNLCMYLQSRTR